MIRPIGRMVRDTMATPSSPLLKIYYIFHYNIKNKIRYKCTDMKHYHLPFAARHWTNVVNDYTYRMCHRLQKIYVGK